MCCFPEEPGRTSAGRVLLWFTNSPDAAYAVKRFAECFQMLVGVAVDAEANSAADVFSQRYATQCQGRPVGGGLIEQSVHFLGESVLIADRRNA